MACAVFRTAMDRDNATGRCPWVSLDDESVIWSEKEERRTCVSGMINGRLRRALVVAVEENNDRLSAIDIAKCGVVEIRYCGDFSTRPGVVNTDTSSMVCAHQRWRYTGSTQ